MKRRVVVTGLGILTSNAESARAFADALANGRSGIGEISQFDTGNYACRISGEIPWLPLSTSEETHLDRASILAVRAAEEAMRDAGFEGGTPAAATASQEGLGVAVGTTCGGVLSLEKVSEVLASGGDTNALPDWRIQELSFYAPTLHVAEAVKATGPVNTVTIACASGTHAVGYGTDLIRAGRTPLMLVGGVDVVSRFIYRGFAALNGLGAPPYRAFDKDRCGVVLGEGAAFLMLEDREHALARNARIYAEILGHSFNNDGAHIVNPNPTGEGIARSFRMAMTDAGVTTQDIDHINAHGTGTIANDSAESAAIHLAFGDKAAQVPVASIKPMLGHTSGAAGAVELIAAILSLNGGYVPATINLQEPAPDCPLNLSGERRDMPLKTILSANSGFGGSNAAVVIGPGNAPSEPDSSVSDEQRVVITGAGLTLPDGIETPDALWQRLSGNVPASSETIPLGANGREITAFDIFARTGLTPTKDARRMDTFSAYAVLAGHQALLDAGVVGAEFGESLGLVVGSAYACLESNERFASGLSKVKVNPVIYQNTVSNAVTGYMCMLLNLRGPVSVLNHGWFAGATALAYGYELVRSGRCRAVLAGGAERLCQMTTLSLQRAGVFAQNGGATPYVSQENAEGTGLLPSDGAGFVVLESLASARARGARILAELTGYGYQSSAGQSPEEAVANATRTALDSLVGDSNNLNADQIFSKQAESLTPLRIFGNGNGVSSLEAWELHGIQKAMAGRPSSVYAVKGIVGDTLGASGAIATIAAIKAFGAASEQTSLPTGANGMTSLSQPPVGTSPVLVSNLEQDGSCVVLALTMAPTEAPTQPAA